jgi:hypothetical protein
VALFDDQYFVVARGDLPLLDLTTWGWIHLLVGLILVLVGFGIIRGAPWGWSPAWCSPAVRQGGRSLFSAQVRARFDLVGIDPRGIGASPRCAALRAWTRRWPSCHHSASR